jgi:hypothetical protein
VYAEYGITEHQLGEYKVDHLALSIGGSNSIKNLWPESYRTDWNARVKDRLEDRLHVLVITGTLDLKTAQREIAADWIAAYKKYIGPSPISGQLMTPNRKLTNVIKGRIIEDLQMNPAEVSWRPSR